ncbi:hypothetical protein ACRE_030110 [Hapsidospora chrysogenum ATCC 11550]|uniref:Alcohol acetyltransferase FCK4 n=1 Tax=Hapsidospora chrysogenum (strain ATCC 11550 / CBS 779.69 / DSM 880 / IAM 14645 / JCM 23072 / IMI 49137) TaxID=857340 RepID=A0A086TA11_HAPC1|nr:hypothetical protein ACRE_030110 [Hapsidospora chrysogenum ATCC 11550]
MCGTIVTCRYSLPPELTSGASPDAVETVLRDAVAHTVLEHPILQVSILDEDSPAPSWGQLDSIDLSYHVRWDVVGQDADYEAQFKRRSLWNMDTWFTDLETRPGWRIWALRRAEDFEAIDVILAWNHAHFDGMGGKIFHETLLGHLNRLIGNSDQSQKLPYLSPGVLQLPNPVERLPPKGEELVKYPVTPKYAISSAWSELRPPVLMGKKSHHAHWCPIRAEPFTSTYRTILIAPDTVKNLLVACRQHKTTITGLIHALTFVSLAVQLPKEVQAMTSLTALDHRRFMPSHPASHPWFDPHRSMSNIVSFMLHDYPTSLLDKIRSKAPASGSEDDVISGLEDFVWSDAARVRRELQARLDAGLKNDVIGLLKLVRDWRVQMRDTAKRPRTASWTVTNLGVIDGSGSGGSGGSGCRITRSLFQISSEITGGAFNLSVVSVKGGEMAVDVGWQECTIDVAIGDRLTSDVRLWLEHLGKGGERENGTSA